MDRCAVDRLQEDEKAGVAAKLAAFSCLNLSRVVASSARRSSDIWLLVAPFLRAFSSMIRCSSAVIVSESLAGD